MGTPGVAVQPIGEDNSESAVRFLIEWVSDGEAEARSYLAVTQNLRAQALSPRTVMMSSLRRDRVGVQLCRIPHVFIGILGLRLGFPVRDHPERSYPALEYDVAGASGLPRLMFLLDEDAVLPLPKIYLSEATLGTRQAALRERVKGTVPLRLVSSPDRLEMLILQALSELKQPPVIRDNTDHLFPLVMPEESPPGEASSDHSWHEFVPVVVA